MKHQLNQTLLLLVLLSAFILGCKKEASVPKVTTSEVTEVSQNTAKSGCTLTDDGGANITALGLCWSTSPTPTVSDSIFFVSTNVNSYSFIVKWLTAKTTYYIRAYATNSAGAAYGNTVSFTTLVAVLPVIKGAYPSNITQTTAQCGGEITSDGGAPTTRGVCWSTSENPTIDDSKMVDGTGAGEFTSNITGLSRSTTYYTKAYATNISGTSYGSQMVVRTMQGTVTDIDGNVYQTVLIGAQEWMAENLKVIHYRNGDPIPNLTDMTPWCNTTSGAWCVYDNNAANKDIYGLLYNHYAVSDSKGLCPSGWHVPSNAEWTTLFDYLGGTGVAGYKMQKKRVITGVDIPADNSSGFTGLGGGYRNGFELYNGEFSSLTDCYWGSATSSIKYIWPSYNWVGVDQGFPYSFGVSIRCIKDN